MLLTVIKENETYSKEINNFNVIGKKLQVSIKEQEKKTVTKTMFKEHTTIDVEFQEEAITLGKNMEVIIDTGKTIVFKYDSFERAEATYITAEDFMNMSEKDEL